MAETHLIKMGKNSSLSITFVTMSDKTSPSVLANDSLLANSAKRSATCTSKLDSERDEKMYPARFLPRRSAPIKESLH